MGMDFIEGIEWIDIYITDNAIYVLERLSDLDEVRDFGVVRNIIFNTRSRNEANERIKQEEENIAYKGVVDVRIWCDETVRDTLRFLGSVVGFVRIDEFRLLVNMIIGEWIKEEEQNKRFGRSINGSYGINFARFGEMSYITFNIRRDLWEQMKVFGRWKALNMEECLKLAIIRYLDRRYELIREFLM